MSSDLRGIVAANFGKAVDVLMEGGAICPCELAGDLGTTPVAGDRVTFRPEGNQYFLTAVQPRRRVIRRAGAREGTDRVLAAHVDLALVISAVKPRLKEGLIDRYLVALHHEAIEPVIVLNKSDLDSGDHARRIQLYEELGYATFSVSALLGAGVEHLRAHLKDKTSVLVGHSGVGKSTLLMALIPELDLATSEVSSYSGKGVHTTTTARLYPGVGGLRIIDSPGIRAFGLTGIEKLEVRDYFIEFKEHQPHCRFRDCLHLHDHGCAVRSALEREEIANVRYESYVRIVQSLEH